MVKNDIKHTRIQPFSSPPLQLTSFWAFPYQKATRSKFDHIQSGQEFLMEKGSITYSSTKTSIWACNNAKSHCFAKFGCKIITWEDSTTLLLTMLSKTSNPMVSSVTIHTHLLGGISRWSAKLNQVLPLSKVANIYLSMKQWYISFFCQIWL